MPSRTDMSLDRRNFVTLCGASAVFPAQGYAQAALPANPDVVIVGAGAAGIAAAHRLRAQGTSYVIVEASNRVGGRVFTETSTFGVPYDHGAHWVQNEQRNPYYQRAKDSDYRFYPAPNEYRIFTEDGDATEEENSDLWKIWGEVESAMSTAGRRGRDVSPASVAPTNSDWAKTAWFGVGSWEMGADMEDFSCLDWYESADSNDWYCAQGYGTLVADYANGLTVELDTPVTTIRWEGHGVRVDTPRGTIKAKAVILTVSTGVLANDGIAFDPPLPVRKQESFHAIAMGYYNHIGVKFSEDIFGIGEDGYALHSVGDDGAAFGALTNASNTGLAYCDVGGSFARELELAGEEAAIDFTLSKLRDLIGSDVDKYLEKASATAWGNDPYIRGCYASAKPGSYPMRAVLRESVGDRIFFAGEACHVDMWATVGGADLTGTQAAEDVAKLI